jgi:C-terminal processing protease CtpA/Prc
MTMRAFFQQAWRQRWAALSMSGALAATTALAQTTTPQPPAPVQPSTPAATQPATPVRDAVQQNRDTIEQNRENREAVRDQNRENREQNRDNRDAARDQNRDNRELNRDTRAPAATTTEQRRDDRLDRREERRERLRAALGFALDAAANNGLRLSNLQPNSTFGTAGLRNDDVILRVGDRRFNNNGEFYDWISTVQPGQQLGIVVLRNGREQTINWTPTAEWLREINVTEQVTANNGQLGITLDNQQTQAAIVAAVAPGSMAERAGIRARDQIVSLNGQKISSAQDFEAQSARIEANGPLDLGFSRVVSLHSAAKPVLDIQIPLPADRRDPPAALPMPTTPRAPQPSPPRVDPSQANPGVTPPLPR